MTSSTSQGVKRPAAVIAALVLVIAASRLAGAAGGWVLWKKWEWNGYDSTVAGRGPQTTWEILYTSDTRAQCEATSEARSRVMEESKGASGMTRIIASSGPGHYVVEVRDARGAVTGVGTVEHFCLPDTVDPRAPK